MTNKIKGDEYEIQIRNYKNNEQIMKDETIKKEYKTFIEKYK